MPTATDPIDAGQVLGSLERLRQGIADALAKEAELARTRDQRRLLISREVLAREQQETEALNARIEAIEEVHRSELERRWLRLQARKASIQQVYYDTRTSLADRIKKTKDEKIRRNHAVLVAQRQHRQQELAKAIAAHKEYEEELGRELAGLDAVHAEARRTLRVYRPLLLRNAETPEEGTEALSGDAREEAQAEREKARDALGEVRQSPVVKLFRWVPLEALAALLLIAPLIIARMATGSTAAGWPAVAVAEALLLALWIFGLVQAAPAAGRLRQALRRARGAYAAVRKASQAEVKALKTQVEKEEREQSGTIGSSYQDVDTEVKALMAEGLRKLETQLARMPAQAELLHRRQVARLTEEHEAKVAQIRAEGEETARRRSASRRRALDASDIIVSQAIDQLEGPWSQEIAPIPQRLTELEIEARKRFPAWDAASCESWVAPAAAADAVRIGRIEIDPAQFEGGMPRDERLSLTGEGPFCAPLALGFPHHGSLLIETSGDATPAVEVLFGSVLRLLTSLPPGRASFVFIDPVGLGRGFAGLMHLADYEETLITDRIWTQTAHIEERLAELSEHIEKVIQMYLRNEFPTIADYNAQAGNVAEKYRFLVIAGFPAGFSDTAVQRLMSIAASGPRCGVHLLMQQDLRQPAPSAALQDELQRSCLRVRLGSAGFELVDAPAGARQVTFDAPPDDEATTTLIHRIGRASVDSNRVEVPFEQIAPPADRLWSSSTSEELRVPIGRAGAKKQQMLALGKGTRQHLLIAGKTGSGKSTLFHVMITNLALWCRPQEVEFYLIDFKKGVEFKCYAAHRLPHARVIAIESDREFALSVLQHLDQELKRRGELFRVSGVQDLPAYHRATAEPLPRSLLMIDEFQEFFTEDDAVAQEASLLLDRIVRQGRAFGIHVILGSQTLGGAYTLARATLGQMVVRIALQCNETDAQLIMDESNPAPRLLTRPGEGIYNDQAGAVAANSPFQIVWLPERERETWLERIADRASEAGDVAAPVVFEGNAPAEIRENGELAAALRERPATRPARPRIWLGAPNSIKGPTAAVFARQSGSHLLVVGQSAERTGTLLALSLLSVLAQYPAERAEFVVLDAAWGGEEASPVSRLAEWLPGRVKIGGTAEAPALIAGLAAQLSDESAAAPDRFLIVHGLQRFKCLRPEDDFRFSLDDDNAAPKASQAFAQLLSEGGPAGIHVLTSVDSWNNVSRWIPRKLLAEFEMRVLFQMSATDSSNLIDSPAATHLGLHRALLHNEQLGTAETFRPYAEPDEGWWREVIASLPLA